MLQLLTYPSTVARSFQSPKRRFTRAALVAAVLALAFCAVAPARAQGDLDPYEVQIRELLEKTGSLQLGRQMASGVTNAMLQNMQQSGRPLPDVAVNILKETSAEFFEDLLGDGTDLVKFAAGLYRKHFSQEEIAELVAFYETPLGKKLVATLPEITEASLAWGQARAAERMPAFQAALVRRLEEAGFGGGGKPSE